MAVASRPAIGEEQALGKAYDVALIRKLWPYVKPHWKLLLAWAVFIPLTIAIELAQPYLFRYALTEHILTGKIAALPLDALAYMALVIAQGGLYSELYRTQLDTEQVREAS